MIETGQLPIGPFFWMVMGSITAIVFYELRVVQRNSPPFEQYVATTVSMAALRRLSEEEREEVLDEAETVVINETGKDVWLSSDGLETVLDCYKEKAEGD